MGVVNLDLGMWIIQVPSCVFARFKSVVVGVKRVSVGVDTCVCGV